MIKGRDLSVKDFRPEEILLYSTALEFAMYYGYFEAYIGEKKVFRKSGRERSYYSALRRLLKKGCYLMSREIANKKTIEEMEEFVRKHKDNHLFTSDYIKKQYSGLKGRDYYHNALNIFENIKVDDDTVLVWQAKERFDTHRVCTVCKTVIRTKTDNHYIHKEKINYICEKCEARIYNKEFYDYVKRS